MFKNGIPEWAIPAMFVALASSFFLAFHHPWGALITAVTLGAIVAFGFTRRGQEIYSGLILLVFVVSVIAIGAWLGSLI